jgi:mannose-6-phosphate isomerase-like protein (cupin superfamily)
MADYAKKNIMELDDLAKQFGLSPQVEARFGRKALGGEKGGFSYQKLVPNYRQGFGHHHAAQEETYVIVEGSGRMKLGDDVIDIVQWDAIRVAPKTKRAFESGPDGLVLLAFGAGETGDAEMHEDFWPQGDA